MSDSRGENASEQNVDAVGAPSVTADYIKATVHAAVDMEVKRCESLRKMSGTILTCASIITVALATVAQPLFGFFSADAGLSKVLLGIFCLALGALLVAILLALVSQLRFAYVALPGPQKIMEALDNGNDFTEMESARHYSQGADEIYQGLTKRNDSMRRLLNASAIAVFVAFAAVAVGAAVLLPCAYGMLG